ncbi:uncharacterized protein LOC132565527 [Ylistrum balloti]|uniref:uncharacterized protein LOC132565527 n=1 Tax=Ylistrum balloti TaxID=509963 RepID=UPI002905C827|nr:uncharacterized protein LOC132565527 [Ylistrum balloti]
MVHFTFCISFIATVVVLGTLFPVSTVAEDSSEPEELKVEVIKKPKFCLRKLKAGDIMLVKMEGKIHSTGKVFDSNFKQKQPYVFQHHAGQFEYQMDKALDNMCAGETRKIIIPGGGERQNFTTKSGVEVSANDTLEFVVELQDIQDSPDHVMVFNLLNTDKSGKLSVAQFMAIAAQGLQMFPMITSLEEMETLVEEIFRLSDKDGDGFLDLEEYLDSTFVTRNNPEHEDAINKKLEQIRKPKVLVVVLAAFALAEEGINKKGDLPEVEIEVLVAPSEERCSKKSKPKDVLKVHFDGFLPDGTPFDSSRTNGGSPIIVQLGSKSVIKGFDIGLVDMCVGEKRKLTIPPRFAYGSQGRGGVPAKSTVIFEVELYEIQGGIGLSEAFARLDLDMDGFIDTNEFEDQLKAASKTKEFPVPQDEFMIRQIVQMAFQSGDKDRDGLLSERELGKIPGLKNIFRKDEL